MASPLAQLLSSSTTGIITGSTLTIPGPTTFASFTPTIYTTAKTITTTVTETIPVIIGQPTPSYTSLTTYTSTFTSYETYTIPTQTIITGGTGEVGGITIIGTIYELWMYFLCPSKDCSPWREWLTFIPNVAAGWVIGALALLLALALLVMAIKCGGLEYVLGFLALCLVAICLFLRAALRHSGADLFTMYKVAVWFNYFAAVLLAMLIAQLVFRLIVHLDNTLCGAARALVGFVYLMAAVLFALLTAALVLMFNKHSFSKMHSGIHCLQAFTIIVLVLAVVLLLAAAWASSQDVGGHHMGHVIIIGACAFMLLLWACFMTARVFLDSLHDAGRHSEALWYIFDIVPLLLIAVILLALNAPSIFTFCHCQVNNCPACNPHVRYSGAPAAAPRHPYTATHDREANVNKYYM
ncbi:hypothetical protein GGH94_005669 [Coemansia aciculifera]|uniref:Uncharacterized protein n=1 Tax=Coemansia aciculifera TaxID=417176 RepID=A0A9W8IFM6_9FUNG|nr:hypothetical protein GGH94_005669 [Coemansia aciculifera]KAJ2871753.1 hypothetical protein GGH93_004568 [Coemansia aciculifera]KAJ2880119.1 hypothetical protein H4R27_004916 [Coemansia aciculifera]